MSFERERSFNEQERAYVKINQTSKKLSKLWSSLTNLIISYQQLLEIDERDSFRTESKISAIFNERYKADIKLCWERKVLILKLNVELRPWARQTLSLFGIWQQKLLTRYGKAFALTSRSLANLPIN